MQKGLVTKPPGRAATMWGGWDELRAAVSRGEVKILKNEDGQEFYQWQEFNETQTNSLRGGMGTSGNTKISTGQYHDVNAHLRAIGISLDLDLSPSTTKSLGAPQGEIPAKVFTNLQKVQKACDKGMSDAKSMFRRLVTLAATDPTSQVLYDKL